MMTSSQKLICHVHFLILVRYTAKLSSLVAFGEILQEIIGVDKFTYPHPPANVYARRPPSEGLLDENVKLWIVQKQTLNLTLFLTMNEYSKYRWEKFLHKLWEFYNIYNILKISDKVIFHAFPTYTFHSSVRWIKYSILLISNTIYIVCKNWKTWNKSDEKINRFFALIKCYMKILLPCLHNFFF